ncbi:MAG: zinc ABC transporter substrate-binding protein [Pseudomonadota bacterium]
MFLTSLLVFLLSANIGLANDRLSVVAVNYPLQYIAERLLGERADVVFPVPEGVDPSFWRPTIADISNIQAADLILLNGAGFASWVDRVSLPRSKLVDTSAGIKDQLIVTESIVHSHGDGGEHTHEGIATYTWLDPTLAIAQARAIMAAAIRLGLVDANDVEDSFDALSADLEMLDDQTQKALNGSTDVHLIATHPRYQYFARRYAVPISALEWDAGSEPSDEQVKDLEKLVSETGARILIWEAEPSAGTVEAIAELGVTSVTFSPLAQPTDGMDYLQAIEMAVSGLADAIGRQSDN